MYGITITASFYTPVSSKCFALPFKRLVSTGGSTYPAVTLSIAKCQGADAMTIAEQVDTMIGQLHGSLISSDIQVTTTRNYGETATPKKV